MTGIEGPDGEPCAAKATGRGLLRNAVTFERKVNMATDNLLGAEVRIRRGWHGGRTGRVIVCDRHSGSTTSYSVIKVKLDGSGQVVNINTDEELEILADQPVGSAVG